MKLYIYILFDPETHEPKYVGKTNNLNYRLYRHLLNPSNHYNPHLYRWMKNLRDCKLEPYMEILEECDEDSWSEREQYWILTLRSLGYNLCNITDGGEGHKVAAGFSASHREKISDAMLNNWNNSDYVKSMMEARKGSALKIARKLEAAWDNPEYREKQSERLRIIARTRNVPTEIIAANGRKGAHVTWHFNRNIIVDSCIHCLTSALLACGIPPDEVSQYLP